MGNLPPKTSALKWVSQHLTHCWLPHCSPRATEFPRSGQLFVRPTFSELQGVIFAYFSNTKMPKKYLFVWGLQPIDYILECFRLFCVVPEEPQGCHLLKGFSWDFY